MIALILKENPTALVGRSIMMKIGEVGLKIKINGRSAPPANHSGGVGGQNSW